MSASRALTFAILAVLTATAFDSAVAADTTGYVYTPITPCRIVDTRVTGTPFAAKETRVLSTNGAATQGGGACTVYAGSIPAALSVNVTVDATSLGSPAQYGFLSFTPTSSAGNSWMNFFGGEIIANAGVATINDTDGSFAIKTQNPANVVIDVYGYWVPSQTQAGLGDGSTVMGDMATASGTGSMAIGVMAQASGFNSTAVGAYTNASGVNSTALGSYTIANGDSSTAMGQLAYTNGYTNSFVFGDGNSVEIPSYTANTANYQFTVRASGGFVFYTAPAADTTTGVALPAGSGSWTALSDRNAKDAVQSIDSRDVLDRVIAMPLNTWHYKAQDSRYRHMGPMAQDFYAAFHLGESDTGIDTIDADGVALAAIQGLNAKLVDKDKEIEALKLRVASLESVAGDIVEIKSELAALKHARMLGDTVVAMTSERSQ